MNWNPTAKFLVVVLMVYGIANIIPEFINWLLVLILVGMILMSPSQYSALINYVSK